MPALQPPVRTMRVATAVAEPRLRDAFERRPVELLDSEHSRWRDGRNEARATVSLHVFTDGA
jgi:putative SOS response-associated peptidase YedK